MKFRKLTIENYKSFQFATEICFPEGEDGRSIFLIGGMNGAGKTSIIRMIYGFSPLSSGKLNVFGLDIREDWRKIRARIGVCQQENTLDPDLTVEENLLIFAGYFQIPSEAAKARTEALLDFFALVPKRKAKVAELSGGLARRLTVARALINDPELVILDEPTTGLDPQSRHQLWDKLLELRRNGVTLVLTTHYMEEASYLCDRLMIVDHGKIMVEGSPRDLIQKYAGESVIEIEGSDESLKQFLTEQKVPHDIMDQRIIIYADNSRGEYIRSHFCVQKCTFRMATLEDVFLHLTGRELRE